MTTTSTCMNRVLEEIATRRTELRDRLERLEGEAASLRREIAALDRAEKTLLGSEIAKKGNEGKCRGGYARAASLTPERRSEIARAAAKARWAEDDQESLP